MNSKTSVSSGSNLNNLNSVNIVNTVNTENSVQAVHSAISISDGISLFDSSSKGQSATKIIIIPNGGGCIQIQQ